MICVCPSLEGSAGTGCSSVPVWSIREVIVFNMREKCKLSSDMLTAQKFDRTWPVQLRAHLLKVGQLSRCFDWSEPSRTCPDGVIRGKILEVHIKSFPSIPYMRQLAKYRASYRAARFTLLILAKMSRFWHRVPCYRPHTLLCLSNLISVQGAIMACACFEPIVGCMEQRQKVLVSTGR